jgi:hypothetical protein
LPSPAPPAQREKRGALNAHVVPPLKEKPARLPWEPPSFQRSCCQYATTFSGFVGLTATCVSTSAFW